MTSNFDDLMYWSSDDYFIGKNLDTAISNIKNVLNKLESDGHKPREWTDEDENSCTNPSWLFGVRREHPNSCITVNLPDNECKSILMFNLHNHLKFLTEIKDELDSDKEYILIDELDSDNADH